MVRLRLRCAGTERVRQHEARRHLTGRALCRHTYLLLMGPSWAQAYELPYTGSHIHVYCGAACLRLLPAAAHSAAACLLLLTLLRLPLPLADAVAAAAAYTLQKVMPS
jgi:hypothetical protein